MPEEVKSQESKNTQTESKNTQTESKNTQTESKNTQTDKKPSQEPAKLGQTGVGRAQAFARVLAPDPTRSKTFDYRLKIEEDRYESELLKKTQTSGRRLI